MEDRRLGRDSLEVATVIKQTAGMWVNSFCFGQRTDDCELSQIVSATVDRQTSGNRVEYDSSQIFLALVDEQTFGIQFDWDSSQSTVLGILCAKKFRVSQFWEHGNWHWTSFSLIAANNFSSRVVDNLLLDIYSERIFDKYAQPYSTIPIQGTYFIHVLFSIVVMDLYSIIRLMDSW